MSTLQSKLPAKFYRKSIIILISSAQRCMSHQFGHQTPPPMATGSSRMRIDPNDRQSGVQAIDPIGSHKLSFFVDHGSLLD